jgi:hypothetical protein
MAVEIESITKQIHTSNRRVSLRVPVSFEPCRLAKAFNLDLMVSDPHLMDVIGLKVITNEFPPDLDEAIDEEFYTEFARDVYAEFVDTESETLTVDYRIEKNFGSHPFVVIIDDVHFLDLGRGYAVAMERRFYFWVSHDWLIWALIMREKQDSTTSMDFYEDCIKTLHIMPRGYTGLRF